MQFVVLICNIDSSLLNRNVTAGRSATAHRGAISKYNCDVSWRYSIFQKEKFTIQYLVLKLRLLRTQSRPSRTSPTFRPCTVAVTSRNRHLVLAQVHQPVHNIHTLSNLSGEVMSQVLCVVTSYGLVSSYICFRRVSYQHFQG